jgi:hypothetical protein
MSKMLHIRSSPDGVHATLKARAAVLVLLLIAGAAAPAGEIPTDTNTIEQLTPAACPSVA